MMQLQQPGRGVYAPRAMAKMLDVVRRKGPLSRASLGAYLGGPAPTVLDKRITRLVATGEIEIAPNGMIGAKTEVVRG